MKYTIVSAMAWLSALSWVDVAEARHHSLLLQCRIDFAELREGHTTTPHGLDGSLRFAIDLARARGRTSYIKVLEVNADKVGNVEFAGKLRAIVSNVGWPVGNVGGPHETGPLNRSHYVMSISHTNNGSTVSYARAYFSKEIFPRVEGYSGDHGIADYAVSCEPMRRLRSRVNYRLRH